LSGSDIGSLSQREAEGRPAFAAPWQAHAFALVISLHRQGAFDWDEWVSAFSAQLARDSRDGSEDYYHSWITALESVLTARGLANAAALNQRKQDWADAYRRTPHGHAVVLRT
jgi:nitrile hydratase accessory protein